MARLRPRSRRSRLLFVTGASGFLGRHLVNGPSGAQWEIMAPPSTSLDVTRGDRVVEAITSWRPTAVIHLAYRRDDRRVVVDGSRNVARSAAACHARLVHLSTDVVFPGRPAPYTERDHPFAITDYGRAKVDAEVAVAEECPSAVIVRTSLLYGTDHLAPLQLDVRRVLTESSTSGRAAMTFFTDEVRCPAHADDVAAAISHLAATPEISGPLHVAGPEPLSRAEFAAAIASWMGLQPAMLRTGTLTESGMARPARIVLDTNLAASYGITCRPVSAALR